MFLIAEYMIEVIVIYGGVKMKICPKCGKVASYNSYFGVYLCSNCDWEYNPIHNKHSRYRLVKGNVKINVKDKKG